MFRGSQMNSGGPRPLGPEARRNAGSEHVRIRRCARFRGLSTQSALAQASATRSPVRVPSDDY